MTETLVAILLMFNGEMVLKEYPFEGSMMECFERGDKLRLELSEYKELGLNGSGMDQGWYLNDGRGTWQGFICK
jgi:hypothetical protein